MARPTVPFALTRGPFTVEEARRAGLTERQLQSSAWKRLGHGLYVWSRIQIDPQVKLQAAWRRLPPGSAFSGWTAAWIHGLEARFPEPIDVTVPLGCGVAGRAGLRVHREPLPPEELIARRGYSVTSVVRTLVDIAESSALADVVPLADAALHAKLIRPADLRRRLAALAGRKGCRAFAEVVEHCDGRAESPMESRLRLLLDAAGLPRPELQVNLRDRFGRLVARADLYYPEHRLVIEFDGAVHRDSLVEDNRRQNRIIAAGYALLRFTGADVLGRPEAVVAAVRAELAKASFPGKSTHLQELIG